MLAAIPAPPGNGINLGPLEIRAYGLAIAVGVITALTIARRRWAARGGSPDDIAKLATWSVIAGLAGARLYHVITDYHRFEGRWLDVFAIWKGGLGIPGGLVAGVVAGVVLARRRGLPAARLLQMQQPPPSWDRRSSRFSPGTDCRSRDLDSPSIFMREFFS